MIIQISPNNEITLVQIDPNELGENGEIDFDSFGVLIGDCTGENWAAYYELEGVESMPDIEYIAVIDDDSQYRNVPINEIVSALMSQDIYGSVVICKRINFEPCDLTDAEVNAFMERINGNS